MLANSIIVCGLGFIAALPYIFRVRVTLWLADRLILLASEVHKEQVNRRLTEDEAISEFIEHSGTFAVGLPLISSGIVDIEPAFRKASAETNARVQQCFDQNGWLPGYATSFYCCARAAQFLGKPWSRRTPAGLKSLFALRFLSTPQGAIRFTRIPNEQPNLQDIARSIESKVHDHLNNSRFKRKYA